MDIESLAQQCGLISATRVAKWGGMVNRLKEGGRVIAGYLPELACAVKGH
jgi:hypothetical protein